jgi:outer membrane protein OmpA-like peptidoglycan-associated protein
LKADNGVLDSNIALSLYHFQMKSVSKEDAAKLDEMFGMPLNQTLVLLRDKDDSIHLDIPITGDVNNPNFEPMDAIIKATSKAATVTLITFYTPYGLIYAGGNIALNLATALNFDPIEFDPGSTELQTNSKEQLDGLSKLLTEKPQVHLTLCGITNKQDVFALYPELKPKKENADKTNKDAPLTKEQTLKLDQLARDRQVNSKNYLIKQHNIDHSRLILCAPEHKDNDENISGVEINI